MTDDTNDDGRNINLVVAAVMAAGAVTALVGLFILVDVRVVLVGIGAVFVAFSGQAALDQYRLGTGEL